jgi:hypothetical protein
MASPEKIKAAKGINPFDTGPLLLGDLEVT